MGARLLLSSRIFGLVAHLNSYFGFYWLDSTWKDAPFYRDMNQTFVEGVAAPPKPPVLPKPPAPRTLSSSFSTTTTSGIAI